MALMIHDGDGGNGDGDDDDDATNGLELLYWGPIYFRGTSPAG